jgi:hypothetical protein
LTKPIKSKTYSLIEELTDLLWTPWLKGFVDATSIKPRECLFLLEI